MPNPWFLVLLFLLVFLARGVQLYSQRDACYKRGGFPYTDGWNTLCFSKDIMK